MASSHPTPFKKNFFGAQNDCSGPIIRTNKALAIKMQDDNVTDAINAGADAIVTICPICDWVFRRPTSRQGIPKIFITDLCRMALGEIPWQ